MPPPAALSCNVAHTWARCCRLHSQAMGQEPFLHVVERDKAVIIYIYIFIYIYTYG